MDPQGPLKPRAGDGFQWISITRGWWQAAGGQSQGKRDGASVQMTLIMCRFPGICADLQGSGRFGGSFSMGMGERKGKAKPTLQEDSSHTSVAGGAIQAREAKT